ncbi:YceK/YidQ family lipoprotein [Xanthomonas citri pv. citri]|nr:YceK/YidQ family lipoprotein [Xanthomonas citri pv. citri]
MLKILSLAILSQNLTACGTIVSLTGGDYSVYAGVTKDFETIQNGGILSIPAVVDLPLSFVLDTLILPVTLSQ